MSESDSQDIARAAAAIAEADGLVIAAGAGMGVDSGLPDFCGDQGFWKAYPPYQKLGLNFVALANPHWFERDPSLAWGFYGHRLNLYRGTRPHSGFRILRSWAMQKSHGAFVYTSNVDGHFQKAGFELTRIYEVHGAIDWLQCTKNCRIGNVRPMDTRIDIDDRTMRACGPLPTCIACGALARPNILMFNDWSWNSQRSDEQAERLDRWLAMLRARQLVIIEIGAGMAVPTVRRFCENLSQRRLARLIRINVREPEVPEGHIGLAMNALAALQRIDAQFPRVADRPTADH